MKVIVRTRMPLYRMQHPPQLLLQGGQHSQSVWWQQILSTLIDHHHWTVGPPAADIPADILVIRDQPRPKTMALFFLRSYVDDATEQFSIHGGQSAPPVSLLPSNIELKRIRQALGRLPTALFLLVEPSHYSSALEAIQYFLFDNLLCTVDPSFLPTLIPCQSVQETQDALLRLIVPPTFTPPTATLGSVCQSTCVLTTMTTDANTTTLMRKLLRTCSSDEHRLLTEREEEQLTQGLETIQNIGLATMDQLVHGCRLDRQQAKAIFDFFENDLYID